MLKGYVGLNAKPDICNIGLVLYGPKIPSYQAQFLCWHLKESIMTSREIVELEIFEYKVGVENTEREIS